jgi:hypothetical protein
MAVFKKGRKWFSDWYDRAGRRHRKSHNTQADAERADRDIKKWKMTLADFFDRHDASELLAQGVMELDPDTRDLDRMLQEYWKQPNSQQLNIRVPRGAKHMIEKLARRKTLQVSTLVRMWVIDAMRREAQKP